MSIFCCPPSRTGYRFAGWYKDEGLTEAWSFESDAVTEDITLYARWVKRISGSGPVIQVDQDGVQNAASVSSREEGGRKTITVVLETGRISEKLAQRRAGSVVTVLVSEQTDTADVQLDGKLAKVMEDTQAVLEIRTGIADYRLPMQQINMDSLIGGFGEDVEPSTSARRNLRSRRRSNHSRGRRYKGELRDRRSARRLHREVYL